MIEVSNLSKAYRINVKEPGLRGVAKSLFHTKWIEKIAIDNITFNVQEGQSLACIGENGAGKSTLIKMLIGILKPTNGLITVYGKNPRLDRTEYLRNIGVIFGQKSNLWIDIPVIESYNATQVLYKLDKDSFRKKLDMVTDLLELSSILTIPARKLSLGQRMKADIGLVFLHNPQILYLDEPTIGLDINVKHTIRSFLRKMNKEQHTSIILTSHDLDDIDEICTSAIILSKGAIIYDGTIENLKHSYVKDKMVKIKGIQIGKMLSTLNDIKIVNEGNYTKIFYNTEKYTSEQILTSISKAFIVEDITIQDPDIDEVVSKIFQMS
ncbi:MAG: ATP-binding cassette domain-containing protein [Coxiellaceae bacterium]|jgi:ABC-2 type transport system ATP-binding protein|nr:ATP-binding cassette domain-containing protein [Coxiellaceae bacterium]